MGRPHHGLMAWQEAMEVARGIYAVTADFPATERFGLTSQMRRAAVSVPSNIAEGCARGTARETLHFLYIARGSLSELDTQARLAGDFGFCDPTPVLDQIERLFARLAALIRALRASTYPSKAAKLPPHKPRSGADD